MVNIFRALIFKFLVPVAVVVLAQKLYHAQGMISLVDLWIRAYDSCAEASEWVDSFLPESVYNDDNIWSGGASSSGEEEENRRPVYFKPMAENSSISSSHSIAGQKTYFSSSMRPRRWRTSNILYRIGEAIYSNTLKLYCVIIGWDKVAKAPEEWLDQVYRDSKEEKRGQAHYLSVCAYVSVGEGGTEESLFIYHPQDELSSVDWIPPPLTFKLTSLQAHFDIKSERDFAEMKYPYPPRPWLRRIYPVD